MFSDQHARKTRTKGMPATPRPRSSRFAALAAAVLALSASSAAQAQTVHNAFGKYSVIFNAQNSAFNSVHQFNGNENELCCFGRNQITTAPDDHLLLQFVADPGYAFKTMSMGFTQFYLSTNAFQGFIEYHGDWSVSTGTFAPGTESWRYDFIDDHIGWDQNGTGGTFFRQNYFWNSGGVHSFLPIMSSAGIDFNDVAEFTLDMNIGGAANGVYGTYLDVYAETELAPITTAPEPASLALLGTGLLGIGGVVSRRRRARPA